MIAGVPHQGGATWAVLQYILGLRRLGHQVLFIEPVEAEAIRPTGAGLTDSENAAYFRRVVREFGLDGAAALLLAGTKETLGMGYEELRRIASDCDVLLNISGMLADGELLEAIPRRVYLDLDPAFVQLWCAVEGIDMRFDAHTHFVTVGLSIGTPDSSIPTCGRTWISTLQPIVLEHWPAAETIEHDAFTTVANWRGYGSVHHGGVFYGQKAHSVRPFFELPSRTRERVRLALSIHPDEVSDLQALSANGWELLEPSRLTGTPGDYQRFVRGSKGEIGFAKSGYVEAACGWFSDRSICYLASGRPVLAQDTGFTRHLPVGEGLLAFATLDDAVHGIDVLRSDYARHAVAARELAASHFESGRVLSRLLDEVGAIW
ncbi:MAG: hypothetical protein GEU90_06380 [Gemmatimonas sp.]|nr:hypothetical protein [Gemmatimonas sp.]